MKANSAISKFPWAKWFSRDWLTDPKVTLCSAATRGIWMDALCAMMIDGCSGELVGTVESLARICRCKPDEMEKAIEEIRSCDVATVTLGHGKVTLINRRMQREYNARKSNALRQKRHRNAKSNGRSNSDITGEKSDVRSQMSEKEGERAHEMPAKRLPQTRDDHGLIDCSSVRMVYDTLGVVPDLYNQQLIEARVTDHAIWGQVLVVWKSNEYRRRSFGKMLEAYGERVAEKQTRISCSRIGTSMPDKESSVELAPDNIGESIPPAILDRMILTKNRQFVDTWLAPARYERHDEIIKLYVPNHLFVEWITEQAMNELRECFQCKTVEVRDVSIERKRRSTGAGSGISRQATTVSPSDGGGSALRRGAAEHAPVKLAAR